MSDAKKRSLLVRKATLLGFFSFAIVSFVVFCTQSSYFMYVRFLLGWPGIIVQKALGIDDKYLDGFGRSVTYLTIVNGLLGALLFGFVAFCIRRTEEDFERGRK